VLLALTNTAATLCGIVAPFFVSLVAHSPVGSAALYREWRLVLTVAALVHVVGAVVFCIFGEAREQPWATFAAEVEQRIKSCPVDVDESLDGTTAAVMLGSVRKPHPSLDSLGVQLSLDTSGSLNSRLLSDTEREEAA
jgi:sugar phosphate permease